MTPEPAHRLPPAALQLWRLQASGVAVLAVAVVLGTLGPLWALPALVVATAAAIVVPGLRYRHWRYEVREEEIDLRYGVFTVRRTLVPIRRVQHVDSSVGPAQSLFDLASVSFHTAAGETDIPALTRADAEAVRRRVGELARVRDDT